MKLASLAAVSLLVLAGTAHAQMQQRSLNPNARMYGELGYSHLNVEVGGGSSDANPAILRGIVGYNLHPNLAAEAMLGFNVRDDDISGTALGVPFTGELRVRNTFGVFAKPKLEMGPLEVFGRAGVTRTRVRTSVTAGGLGGSATNAETDFAFGAGVNYHFTPRAYAGLDLMRYMDKGGTRVDGATISIGTRW